MESTLDLRHHRPGTRPQLAPYLHKRTAGRIGSLIRQAAITALIDGTERITKTTLEAIRQAVPVLAHVVTAPRASRHLAHRPAPSRSPCPSATLTGAPTGPPNGKGGAA
ncbi:hypothetical protein [Streptomyces asiaticus]|uniref:hypothetical protein n=1 Tax=Streptomyces asiaticus TaxID=114695 RepID=UPI003F674E19